MPVKKQYLHQQILFLTNPKKKLRKNRRGLKNRIILQKMPQSPGEPSPIFISSTFADMQAERDHLKHVVFPLVEEELQKRRIKLEIVDLRWGVDTTSMEQEDEREASVLKVALMKFGVAGHSLLVCWATATAGCRLWKG
jgi:hypothetical protein